MNVCFKISGLPVLRKLEYILHTSGVVACVSIYKGRNSLSGMSFLISEKSMWRVGGTSENIHDHGLHVNVS